MRLTGFILFLLLASGWPMNAAPAIGPESPFTQTLKTNVNSANWRSALGISGSGTLSIQVNGSLIGTATTLNFVENSGISLSPTNNAGVVSIGVNVYYPPTIDSFVNDQNNREIGSSVTQTILTWTLSGATVLTQHLSHAIGSIAPPTLSHTHIQTYSTNRTFTLTVGDARTNDLATTSVSFLHKRYWGVSANTSLTDGQIIAQISELSTSRVQSRTFFPSGQYIYFAFPVSFGAAAFTVNGLSNTAWTLVTRAFINASGYSESFNIYRSDNVLTGTYTVAVL